MKELTLKEIVASVSKIRQMEETGLRENDTFTLAFHVIKIYKIHQLLTNSIASIKTILLERKIPKTYFWEDELKIGLGNKNSTSIIDIKSVWEFAVKNKLEDEFFAACNIVESKVTNVQLQATILLNKTITPGEIDADIKIEKITKAEKQSNV